MQIDGCGGREQVYCSLRHCVSQIWHKEGLRGLYKGCLANNLRMLPNGSIQFATYDVLKRLLQV